MYPLEALAGYRDSAILQKLQTLNVIVLNKKFPFINCGVEIQINNVCWVVGNYPKSLIIFTKNLLFWITPEDALKLDDQQESVGLSPSDYMQEKITCDSCNEDTARKDLHWNLGGGSYTDTCEICFQKQSKESI